MKLSSPRLLTAFRAGVALAAMSVWGCVSSSDLERLGTQLSGIEQQILQLQKQGAEKADLQELRAALETELQALRRAQADLQIGLDSLTARIRELESRLEDASFRLSRVEQQVEVTNQELQDFRSAREAQVRPPAPAPSPSLDPQDPQAVYDNAYSAYQGGNYDLAILGFLEYLDAEPRGEQADNATYWIGECYYQQRKFQQAIGQFDRVLDRFPTSDRLPSALLRKGYAYLELGQRNRGIVQLQRVVCEYQATDEAQLARQRLTELGIDPDC